MLISNKTTISAIIPTKNRPIDLTKSVMSVLRQSQPPDEIIIVDQSAGKESLNIITAVLNSVLNIKLKYIHDPTISGLVEAKDISVKYASGNIICFLEDDIVLDPFYLEQIKIGFSCNLEMIGCCGVITNPVYTSKIYILLHKVFHQGIFYDERLSYFHDYTGFGHPLIPSSMISGGMSAWRREIFNFVNFDLSSGFHMYEDIDFSTRVEKYFGPHLYINPNARLAHYCSPINRSTGGSSQRQKVKESITYFKKRRTVNLAKVAICWLLIGLLFESIAKSILNRSLGVLQGYILGVKDGFFR